MELTSQLYLFFYVLSLILIGIFLFLIFMLNFKRIEEHGLEHKPPVNLYVPCKNTSKNFEKNIKSIISQNYTKLSIYFIVESKKDSAYPVLKKTVKKHKILIAGSARNCSQKNHNLLFGIKNSKESDIYAFFDSDIYFEKKAVSKLVSSLTNKKNTVVTSFPKKEQGNRNLAESIYHFYYGFQYILCSSFKAVWGGYFAIFSKDFNKLRVKELWSTRVSDDMPLTKLLIKKRFDVKFLRNVQIFDNNLHENVGSAFSWIQRQTLMIKHYLGMYWAYSIIFLLCFVFANMGLLITTMLDISFYKLLFDIIIISAMFLVLHAINKILTRNAGLVWDLKFFIPALSVILASILSTVFIRDVIWGDYRYKISKGTVKIIHHNK